MLMALLHPDNIILSIVAEWCDSFSLTGLFFSRPKTKDGSFARAVDALLDLNLISSGYEGKTASIHRCIQADVRERVQVGSVKSQSRGLADFYLAALKQKDRLLDAIKKGNAGEIDVFIRDKPVLDLSHLHLGDKAVVMLVPSLSASLTLHTLDLTGNDLSHVSIVSLAESVRKMPLLHTLILRMNRIGPVGSAALASCLGTQSTLRKLNIRQNELQSDGATALATALLSNTSLEVLDISMNGITSDGAQAIWEALASNTTLKKLRTEGNELAEQALSKLITSEKLSLEEVSHSSPTLDSKILHARMSVTCTTRFINADAITSRFVSKISSVTPSASSSGWDD
ncbi:hypothetical protein DFJ73DRAFT_834276 [Zopfochytrium polystomum]|nr:hypothetical protein DFJ73DRAFT_834276 [Zopfochytrium polystomum]